MSVGTVPAPIQTPISMPTMISTASDGIDTWMTWNTPARISIQVCPRSTPKTPVNASPSASGIWGVKSP